MISYVRLHELLDYDPVGGVFTWAVSRGFKKRGTKASSDRLTLDGKTYQAGKLAWLYTYCQWPCNRFHYVNGDKTDIRLENLANHRRGARKPSKFGLYSVKMTTTADGYSLSLIEKYKKPVDLGTYETYEQASEVQRMALLCSK